MSQDINDMKFCESCKMNVFPSRPKFNVKIFGIFAVIILIVLVVVTVITSFVLAGILLFLYYFWFFIVVNPYVFYYSIKKKQNCPRCFQKVVEKNLLYQPFGEKEPELYRTIAPVKNASPKLFCPYCATPMSKKGQYCKSCGKKYEIQRE
ncbi:MAG: hypothetical protein ACFE8L_09125 [Candidatus Hodarchaeota archaeon]